MTNDKERSNPWKETSNTGRARHRRTEQKGGDSGKRKAETPTFAVANYVVRGGEAES